jgi:epoxyqueuosine reductase QueG
VSELKKLIRKEADRLGIDLIGFGNVERYTEDNLVPSAFWPQTTWPWSRTIIVIAAQVFLPVLATTPSILYKELYHTTNRILDDSAYRIAVLLNRKGYRAFSITRDGYLDSRAVNRLPIASFSHVVAGKYAGLGTIGYNHMLLTPKFGPRIRLATVVTDAKLEPDSLIEDDLCIACHLCGKHCPGKAYSPRTDTLIANYDKIACMNSIRHQAARCCGICCLVCPVGEDIFLYRTSVEEVVTACGVTHTQSYGTHAAVGDA